MLRFLFIFAFFVFPFHVFAQNDNDGVPVIDAETAKATQKEKIRQKTALLEQILADAKNLRLPENRALVYSKVGNGLWETDEKRARALFQSAINDLITAQSEAETEKANNKQFLNNLIYGQSPRWEILNIIAVRDAEFALDMIMKTRPSKIAQAISNLNGDRQSQIRQYAKNEIQSEQRIIAMEIKQNPQRAVKLLRENLKKDVSYDTFNILRTIYTKAPETANELADVVAQKLLDSKLDDNQDSSLLLSFLNEFGQERTAESAAPKVSDELLRSLVEKIVKFSLRLDIGLSTSSASIEKVIEKFSPGSIAQINQRQARHENQTQVQNQNAQNQAYSKLTDGDGATVEELLSQAEKFPRYLRDNIYRRAAEKTAASGNFAEAQKIIATNFSDEESENYISRLNHGLAMQAINESRFNEANQFIDQMSEENSRLDALIYLANSIYQKNPKENQKWAATVLNEARSSLPDAPEKTSEVNSLISIAAAYAQIEPAQAFNLIESLTAPLNEFSEASAVVAKFNDSNGNFRRGEYQISTGSVPFAYNLTTVLQTLIDKDFDRTIQFINSFTRLDARINLEIQLINWNLSINGGRRIFINSGSRRRSGGFIID